MSDYVQHDGLTRTVGPRGKPEPMGIAHAWNAPHLASSALMLPRSLPVMACVALYPRLWRRVMDPLVDRIRQL